MRNFTYKTVSIKIKYDYSCLGFAARLTEVISTLRHTQLSSVSGRVSQNDDSASLWESFTMKTATDV